MMGRHTLTTLQEVEHVWKKMEKRLTAQHDHVTIALMRLAYWYAVYTIAPSYAEDRHGTACIAAGEAPASGTHKEAAHEQAYR
jgi:hypothetical protein